MKKFVFILFVTIAFLTFTRPVIAACRQSSAEACTSGNFRMYTLTFPKDPNSKNPYNSADASCTNPVVDSGTTVGMCCDEKSEVNSSDSLRAPLCGASAELDKTNSTCWDCGGLIACSGYDQALGQTDQRLKPEREVPGGSNTIGDDDINRLWRPKDRPTGTFTFNGIEYDAQGKDIIVCGPNLPACMQPNCSNMLYPEINSSGKEGADQCQTVTYGSPGSAGADTTDPTAVAADTDINLDARGTPNPAEGVKDLIDVGGPTDDGAPQFSTLFGDTPVLSPTITALFQLNLNDGKTPIPRDDSSNWGVTQIQLAANGTILSPKNGYPGGIGEGFHYTILYADQGKGTLTIKATAEDNAVYGYTIHLTNLDINPTILDLYQKSMDSNRTKLAAISCGFPLGTPRGGNFKIAIADTGTFIDPRVRKDWWKNPPPGFATTPCAVKSGFITPTLRKSPGASSSSGSYQSCTVVGAPTKAQRINLGALANFINRINGIPVGLTDAFLQGIGIIAPAANTTGVRQLNAPDISEQGGRLENAFAALTPQSIQADTQPIAHTLTTSANGRICAPAAENEWRTFVPKKGIFNVPVPGLNKSLGNSIMYNSYFAKGKRTPAERKIGETHPNEVVAVDTALPCGSADDGTLTKTQMQTGELEHNYNNDPQKQETPKYTAWVQLALDKILAVLENIKSGFCAKNPENDGCKLETAPEVYTIISTRVPYGEKLLDMAANKNGERQGFFNAWVPGVFKLDKTNAKEPQTMIQTIFPQGAGKPIQTDLVYGEVANFEQTADFVLDCALIPQSLQKKNGQNCTDFTSSPSVPNTSDWALPGANQTPINSDFTVPASDVPIQQAIEDAAGGKIPQCVLEGVAFIEGGYSWDINSTQCRPNVCSAAGPFQITVGQDATGDTHCRSCGPSWADGSRTCPDSWSNNWPDDKTATSPCDMQAAASQAVNILQAKADYRGNTLDARPPQQQQQTIIQAGNDYYGSNVSIPRLGGCSYGEFVYKHCVPSYQCGTTR